MEVKKLKKIVIREELFTLTKDTFEAIILSQLIYWQERVNDFDKFIVEERSRNIQYNEEDNNVQLTNGWMYKSAIELKDECMLSISEVTIRRYLQKLIDKHYVECRKNPMNKWDRTLQYRVNMKFVISKVKSLGFDGLSGYKLQEEAMKLQNEDSYQKNEGAIPYTTNRDYYIEEEKEDKSSSKKDDYLPFAAEPQQEYGKVEEKKEWREDFNAYMGLVNKAKSDLLSDSEYKAYIEKYYPNADYENSVGKLVDGFWGTEEGWEYCKKKRKGKTINMLATLKKNLDARSRIVYKPLQTAKVKSSFNGTQNRVKVKLNPNVHLVDNDGKLSDGTFLKADGLRYYFSYIDKKTYSIPLDAEPMPQSEKVAYDYKNGWYECE